MFFVHIVACVYWLQAKLVDFEPETWVYQNGIIDDPLINKYWTSLYWACQTLTTVGYGDCLPVNMWEFIINIIWMIFGVIFYSVLVASVTSNIQAEANNADKLAGTLKLLDDVEKEMHLDEELVTKIRQFLLNNQGDLFTKGDEDSLLNELPMSLKEEVLYY
jgi:hypothetical protein